MKRVLVLLLALGMVLSLMGCMIGKEATPEVTEPPTQAPTEPVRKVIHILLPEAKVAEAMQLTNLVVKDDLDVKVINFATVEEQIKLLEEIAAQSPKDGTYGLVTMPVSVQQPAADVQDDSAEQTEEPAAPVDDTAAKMDAAFAALTEANVSYALADYIPESAASASVANVCYDQRQIGAAAAAYLVANGLTQKQKVVIIQGMSEEEAERTEGFKLYLQGKLALDGQTIEEAWTSLSGIVYSDMQGATQDSAEVYFDTYMESKDHADTKYFAAWDDAYVLGVLEALEGETIDGKIKQTFLDGKPVITGCGGNQAMVDVLTGNSAYTNLDALGGLQTIFYSGDLLNIAAQALSEYFSGTVVEQDQTQPIIWITAENASQYKVSIEG